MTADMPRHEGVRWRPGTDSQGADPLLRVRNLSVTLPTRRGDIKAVDGWDWGLGAEVRAPSLFGQEFPLRLGYRHRILPFEVNTIDVHETDYSLGLGIPVSRGRSRVDLSLTRANRSANVTDVSEHAWIVSAGFFVRP